MSGRRRLPQLDGGLFLTDGGIETTLIFHRGLDLPPSRRSSCSRTSGGPRSSGATTRPTSSWRASARRGFVLESPTWRASPRWAEELGYPPERARRANRKAIELMEELREGAAAGRTGRS